MYGQEFGRWWNLKKKKESMKLKSKVDMNDWPHDVSQFVLWCHKKYRFWFYLGVKNSCGQRPAPQNHFYIEEDEGCFCSQVKQGKGKGSFPEMGLKTEGQVLTSSLPITTNTLWSLSGRLFLQPLWPMYLIVIIEVRGGLWQGHPCGQQFLTCF